MRRTLTLIALLLPFSLNAEKPLNLQTIYAQFNSDYFWNSLPSDTTVAYGLNDPAKMAATTKLAGKYWIRLNYDYTKAPKVAEETILHEQCHIATWNEFDPHGRRWQMCMTRLAEAGAFKELW